MIILWIIVFVVSLAVLVKSADWLIDSAEKIGLALGMSPFIVGILIVGLGTSFPELISSFVAVLKGVTEIVSANAIGSNIANVLLVVGASTVVGKRLVVTKSLIDLDLPLLAIGTVIFLGVAWDRQITLMESILLLAVYGIYLLYTLFHSDEIEDETSKARIIPAKQEKRRRAIFQLEIKGSLKRIALRDVFLMIVGIAGLVVGSKYLIDSLIVLSEELNIAPGIIAVSAVAIGTSLPELIVSMKAALQRKSELALGNIFGSNLFNILVVIGLPGLFKTIVIDEKTFTVALPVMIVATLLFVISGISRRIHMWEGAFYLALYVLFIGKLFDFI